MRDWRIFFLKDEVTNTKEDMNDFTVMTINLMCLQDYSDEADGSQRFSTCGFGGGRISSTSGVA